MTAVILVALMVAAAHVVAIAWVEPRFLGGPPQARTDRLVEGSTVGVEGKPPVSESMRRAA